MNRRNFLQKLAALGVAVGTIDPIQEATKFISIPSNKVFPGTLGNPFSMDANGNITVNQQTEKSYTVLDLHRWLMDLSDRVDDDFLDITSPAPSMRITDNIIELQEGFYVTNPEYLTEGSLKQKDELWAGIKTVGQVEDTSRVLINGEPAIRPGHVNQCVKIENSNEFTIPNVELILKTPGNTYSYFSIDNPTHGINVGALGETVDLCYHDPRGDPCYSLYVNSAPPEYTPMFTNAAQRLAWKGKI